jgi:type IV pilus assembly protein PilB
MDPKVEQVLMRLLSSMEKEAGDAASGEVSADSRQTMLNRMLADGRISETDLAQCAAQVAELEFREVDGERLPTELSHEVPSALAARSRVIPLEVKNGVLHVGAVEGVPPQVLENLRRLSRKQVVQHIITRTELRRGLKHLYGVHPADEYAGAPQRGDEGGVPGVVEGPVPPASQLLQMLLVEALNRKASDVHIEPQEHRLRVRFRVDGVLQEFGFYPRAAIASLVSRIKILSSLDISERRIPQDGGFRFQHGGQSTDIRVSILPTVFGEKVVLRLLMGKSQSISLTDLGMRSEMLARFEHDIAKPHGIILITGPTGSGKSTTLYAAIRHIRAVGTNITTVEDPVEYQIDGVTQTQVDIANKITFASALRSILRQDPDVIMVGEVRDQETSEIALRAALTGHLVFSTLHTNDAPGAVTRLLDMGCEPFLVGSSLNAVVAQRLVRIVCPSCREPFTPSEEYLTLMGVRDPGKERTWYRATGCEKCLHTGYTGRTGVFEHLQVSDAIRAQIVEEISTTELRGVAIEQGMRPLRQAAIDKVDDGTTTPEEALRVTAQD